MIEVWLGFTIKLFRFRVIDAETEQRTPSREFQSEKVEANVP